MFADSAGTLGGDGVGSDRVGSDGVGSDGVGSLYVGSVGGGCASPSAGLWSHNTSAVSPGTRDLLDLADSTLSEASEWRRMHEVSK